MKPVDEVDRVLGGSAAAPPRVHHQLRSVAEALARRLDEGNVLAGVLPERPPAELDGGEAALDVRPGRLPHGGG